MHSVDLPSADLEHVFARTRDLWTEMNGGRLFLSGGTGFIGRWLLESFVWANEALALKASAVVLTRDIAGFQRKAPRIAAHPAITLHYGDVRSFRFPEGPFRFVIHAAAETSPGEDADSSLNLLDIMIQGTRQMLDFGRHCGASAFLMTSSGAVYGKQPAALTHVPESFAGAPDPCSPHSAYAEGKRAAELLCSLYAANYGLQCRIARCFAFAGPFMPFNAQFAIGNFIRDAVAGTPVRVRGDGSPLRSYLYAADLAIWLWTILFRGRTCHPYNVGSESAVSIADLATKIIALTDSGSVVDIAGQRSEQARPDRYVPSTRRARTELGLKQWTSLEDAISRTASWHRQQMSNAFAGG